MPGIRNVPGRKTDVKDSERIADLVRHGLIAKSRKHADLALALDGKIEDYHRFLLTMQLRRLDAAEHDIIALDQRIDEKLEPYRTQHTLLIADPRR
jgi:transposase